MGQFTAPATGVGHAAGAPVDIARILGCALGTCVILLTGLLGRRIGGWRVGLVAAAIAAVYPHFITIDGFLMSEPLYGVIIGGTLLIAYRFAARPTRPGALSLGVLVGLAALTAKRRSYSSRYCCFPCCGARAGSDCSWAAWRARSGARDCPVDGAQLLRVPPVRADLQRLRGRDLGVELCQAYYGNSIGSWTVACVAPPHPSTNEAVRAASEQSQGLRFIGHHLGRAPLVAGVRWLRVWSLYAPNDQTIGNRTVLWIGLAIYYCLLVAAVYALVMLHRRGRKLLILLAPAIVVSITALIGVGLDRLRYDAEIPMIALAAWAVVVVPQTEPRSAKVSLGSWRRLRRWRREGARCWHPGGSTRRMSNG